jgi:hypothetical protein
MKPIRTKNEKTPAIFKTAAKTVASVLRGITFLQLSNYRLSHLHEQAYGRRLCAQKTYDPILPNSPINRCGPEGLGQWSMSK